MRWDTAFGYNVWNQHGISYQHLAPKWSKCRELSHSKLIWLLVKSLGTSKNGWLILERTTHFVACQVFNFDPYPWEHTTRNWHLSKVVKYDFYVGFTKISGSDIVTWFVMWVCLVESPDFNVDCTKKKYGCFSWLWWETWAVWLHDVDDWINKNQVDQTWRFNSLSMVLKQKKSAEATQWIEAHSTCKISPTHMRFNQRYQRQKGNILWALWAGILAYATRGQAWTSMDKHGQAQVGCGIYWNFRSLMGNV